MMIFTQLITWAGAPGLLHVTGMPVCACAYAFLYRVPLAFVVGQSSREERDKQGNHEFCKTIRSRADFSIPLHLLEHPSSCKLYDSLATYAYDNVQLPAQKRLLFVLKSAAPLEFASQSSGEVCETCLNAAVIKRAHYYCLPLHGS